MLDFALQGGNQLTVLRENRQVEVIVVVGDQDFAVGVYADADRVIGDPFAADLTQVDALVAENFDAVRPIVADEDFLFVVDDDAVGEFQVLGTAELLQYRTGLVKDYDAHDLAFDDHDATFVVDRHPSGMLQNVRSEFPNELAVLVVDLNLVRGRPFSHDDVAGGAHHRHPVGVQKLTVAFAALAELKLEPTFLVEYLNAVIIRIGHYYIVLGVHSHATRLGKLTFHNAEFAEFAMVNHFLEKYRVPTQDSFIWQQYRNMATTELNLKVVAVEVKDVRFPTSLQADGSDAMHTDPDYSCAYVTVKLANGLEGNGLTFTNGRGTEVVVQAVKSMSYLVLGQIVTDIYKDFATFWRSLTSESQMRWIGPEKGVTHLATAAIINALWDLWGKLLKKPVWRLLADLEPEVLLSVIDFRYVTNCVTKAEALELLKQGQKGKEERIKVLLETGYPCYTTQAGWLGYPDEKIRELAQKYLDQGYTVFKVKVGKNLQDDIKRCELLRSIIGYDRTLMVDANQVWEVQEAIDWMKHLAKFKPLWIEEPTSPDDVLGHAEIAKALKPYGIAVATGEMCCNRVLFKQFLQAEALEYCQIDSARIGGINEILSVYLMAKKMGVKVCPHAGGVGLCEMVQHLQMWDFVALSGTSEGRVVEFVDQQHEHFVDPCVIKNAHYMAPTSSGYSTTMKPESLAAYVYPNGTEWESMFAKGLFHDPRK